MRNGALMRSRWRGRVGFLPGLIVSGISLMLLIRNVEWIQLWAALRGAEYWWLLLSVLALLLALGLKVLRWWLLVLPAGNVSPRHLLYSLSVGYLINTLLPGRLGELARVYLLARLEPVPLATALSTVAVDRVLDVVVLVFMLAVSLPGASLPDWVARSGLVVGGGGAGLLVAFLLLAHPMGREALLRWLKAGPRFPGKVMVERRMAELWLGVEGLRGVGPLVRVGAVSLAIWLATVLVFYFGQQAFHLSSSVWPAVLVTATTSMGMVVPSSPGYVGVFHYLVVLSLTAFRVEREAALGYAVVIHLVETLCLGVMGVFSLWRCGVSLMGWRGEAPGVESPVLTGPES